MLTSFSEIHQGQISPQEHKRLALEFFYKKFNWGPNYFLKNSGDFTFVCKSETFHTSHSWTEEIRVRKATEVDLAVEQALSLILKS